MALASAPLASKSLASAYTVGAPPPSFVIAWCVAANSVHQAGAVTA